MKPNFSSQYFRVEIILYECKRKQEIYLKFFNIKSRKKLLSRLLRYESNNSYFLHWNFDWKSCFVVFFLEWNEWKNPQFNFLSQNLSIECNFFKWEWKKHFKGFPPFFLAHFVNEHLHFTSFYFMYTVNFFSSQSFSICQYWYTPIII